MRRDRVNEEEIEIETLGEGKKWWERRDEGEGKGRGEGRRRRVMKEEIKLRTTRRIL